MRYNLNRLNTADFELMVQALMQNMLGSNSIVFGNGADGGRELTYNGKSNFTNTEENWDGYWVVQAKFKERLSGEDDFKWVEANFKAEMKKFSRSEYKTPDNYIFLTNAVLTPVNTVGGRDKIEELKDTYKPLIKNIFIGGYDEVCRYLDNNRDVATA